MDYKNAKIYKVLNDVTDDVYVGSTCQTLSKRMAEHRKAYYAPRSCHFTLYKKYGSWVLTIFILN